MRGPGRPDGGSGSVLPLGWAEAPVARLGIVRLGRQRSPDKQTGRHTTKYLRAANITPSGLDLSDLLEMDFDPGEREVYALRRGDVVLTEASGSASQVGRAALWNDEVPGLCFQNTVIRFRPHAVTPGYALVVFRHFAVSGTFARTARGVGIQHLGASRLAGLQVPLPPYAEQERIASEVERRLDELRRAEQSLRSALEQIQVQHREVLAAAVRGDLVESASDALTLDPPPHPGPAERYGTAAVQGSLFPPGEPTPESVGGDRALPHGWRWARVRDIGEVKLGKQLSPEEERGPQPREYLRVANVYEDRIDASDVKRMHFSDEEYQVYRLEPGDLLLNEGQSLELVGRPAMFRGEIPDVCFQNTLIRVRVHAGVDPGYVLVVFRHYLHSGEFQKVAQRSTNIAHLGLQRLAAMPIPVPPLREQLLIAAEVRRRLEASDAQESAVRASLATLPEMDREILAAAVAGTLVPQDPSDEPADVLLDRIGPPTEPVRSIQRPPRAQNSDMSKRQQNRSGAKKKPLPVALREAGKPLRVRELFAFAGYDREDVGEVEEFYVTLRNELARSTVRKIDGEGEDGTVEAVNHAP